MGCRFESYRGHFQKCKSRKELRPFSFLGLSPLIACLSEGQAADSLPAGAAAPVGGAKRVAAGGVEGETDGLVPWFFDPGGAAAGQWAGETDLVHEVVQRPV
jgi:hypothetical protein